MRRPIRDRGPPALFIRMMKMMMIRMIHGLTDMPGALSRLSVSTGTPERPDAAERQGVELRISSGVDEDGGPCPGLA